MAVLQGNRVDPYSVSYAGISNPVTPPTTGQTINGQPWTGLQGSFHANPVTPPTTGVSDPNGLRYGTFTPNPVIPVNGGGNSSNFNGIPSGTNPNPVMPPTGLNPIQSNALKFSDPEASFTPFQAQTFNQPVSSPFGSQQMPSFNMQSFRYPPMNPSNGGGKNWWEMQW